MTPAQAREILDNWRYGAKRYPIETINLALLTTGDITTFDYGQNSNNSTDKKNG